MNRKRRPLADDRHYGNRGRRRARGATRPGRPLVPRARRRAVVEDRPARTLVTSSRFGRPLVVVGSIALFVVLPLFAIGYVVIDLNSTNGTLVNGIRISGEQRLNDGDIISFGSTHVRFEAS